MQKKKKAGRPKPRNVWEIDPATRVHRQRTAYDRDRDKEELKKGLWEEEGEEEEEEDEEE
jgi:hypothetical protein